MEIRKSKLEKGEEKNVSRLGHCGDWSSLFCSWQAIEWRDVDRRSEGEERIGLLRSG
jgi:hypothetical protein